MTILRDPRSGLLNASYFRVAVPERVAVARRALRPLSLVLVHIGGQLEPLDVATIVLRCLRDADTACQLADGVIGLILEDTPQDGAVWTAERIRREVVAAAPRLRVGAGVATYPAHTLHADELLIAAHQALHVASAGGRSRIEVAPLQ